MKFGVNLFATDYSMPMADLGREVEARGFESLTVAEHTHIPASRESVWPGEGPLPEQYWHSLDPFVALSAVAAVTSRLRMGTGICLVVEHDPISLAKSIASVDHISNGRFLFGVGGGWNREEMANHGTDFDHRFRLMRERITAMKQIWMEQEATYHGEYVDFDRIWSWPKPVQRPHPPILVGGEAPNVLRRVVAYGDEWMPVVRRVPDFEAKVAELKRLAEEHGRAPIPITAFSAPADAHEVEHMERLGVHRCLFGLPSAQADAVMPRLDALTSLMAKFA